MRVSRLYVETELNAGGRVTLDGEAEHYVRTVLRLKKHDGIVLFNGNGGEYRATLAECSRKNVSADILEWIDRSAESPLTVEFGLAVSRSDRMDFALQKSVELGVGRITPLLTERCVVQLSGERLSQKMQHWQKIARHAAEQCGRTLVPELAEALSLPDWLAAQTGLRVFLDPAAEKTLNRLTPPDGRVTLLSGPEGGFSERERETAQEADFIPVRLGARILRTETAALAAIAAAQTLWGDFSGGRGG